MIFWPQTLNTALENVPKDRNGKISKEYLRVALDTVAPSAGLPPIGAVDEVLKRALIILNTIFKLLVTFHHINLEKVAHLS